MTGLIRRWWRRTFPPCPVTGRGCRVVPKNRLDNGGGSLGFDPHICLDCGRDR